MQETERVSESKIEAALRENNILLQENTAAMKEMNEKLRNLTKEVDSLR